MTIPLKYKLIQRLEEIPGEDFLSLFGNINQNFDDVRHTEQDLRLKVIEACESAYTDRNLEYLNFYAGMVIAYWAMKYGTRPDISYTIDEVEQFSK